MDEDQSVDDYVVGIIEIDRASALKSVVTVVGCDEDLRFWSSLAKNGFHLVNKRPEGLVHGMWVPVDIV